MRKIVRISDSEKKDLEAHVLKEIINAIESIKYGYVQIIIQDSKVVQIDKMEKIRLTQKNNLP